MKQYKKHYFFFCFLILFFSCPVSSLAFQLELIKTFDIKRPYLKRKKKECDIDFIKLVNVEENVKYNSGLINFYPTIWPFYR